MQQLEHAVLQYGLDANFSTVVDTVYELMNASTLHVSLLLLSGSITESNRELLLLSGSITESNRERQLTNQQIKVQLQ
jgi:uncharacterized protein involved in outer membrane biogenesis